MGRSDVKKKLYRKVNSKAYGVLHDFGSDFSKNRNSKRKSREHERGSMNGKTKRGLDYTPLFKFLLSKVGQKWDNVFSEANSRIDKPDPIFWLVALYEDEKQDYVGIGESSYFSGLYVDNSGLLQLVNSKFQPTDLPISCPCCTHTLNGITVNKPYKYS